MEEELDKIEEEGARTGSEVLDDFYGPFATALDAVDIEALIAEAHDLSPEKLADGAVPEVRLASSCSGPAGSGPSSPA